MDLQHVNVKIFVEGELPFDPSQFINVFHEWIQESALPELLIDVADYCHVPDGPGVLLVAQEADYSMDHTDGRWGLRYNRKAAVPGGNRERFQQAFASAAQACRLLEARFAAEKLRFGRNEMELFINDRALAPNTAETLAACAPDIRSFLRELLGHDGFQVDRHNDPRRRFGVLVRSQRPFDFPKGP
jgi:hypothetical protein